LKLADVGARLPGHGCRLARGSPASIIADSFTATSTAAKIG
jgi:hypothetical protein